MASFVYKLGISRRGEEFQEIDFVCNVPLAVGEKVVLENGESLEVFDIEHQLDPILTQAHVCPVDDLVVEEPEPEQFEKPEQVES